jgi:hypothetical protein
VRAGPNSQINSVAISDGTVESSAGVGLRATTIKGLGTVKVSENVIENANSLRTVLLITDHGGHNRINGYEGVVELIRREIWRDG